MKEESLRASQDDILKAIDNWLKNVTPITEDKILEAGKIINQELAILDLNKAKVKMDSKGK